MEKDIIGNDPLIIRMTEYNLKKIYNSEIWKNFPEVKNKKVFIKPNLVTPPTQWDFQSITHPLILEAVLLKCIEGSPSQIVVGCCGFKGQWKRTIELSGYDKICQRYSCDLICLQEGENFHKYSLIRFSDKEEYMSLFGTKISDYLLEAEVGLNLSKMKVHSMARMTGSIKNMMGTISPKGAMHPKGSSDILHKRLRDLYLLMKKYVSWNLMDGIIGSEYNEQYGVSKQANVLISGKDMFEVDWAASQVMGMNPFEIPYLVYIRKRRNFQFDVPKYFVVPFEKPIGWKMV